MTFNKFLHQSHGKFYAAGEFICGMFAFHLTSIYRPLYIAWNFISCKCYLIRIMHSRSLRDKKGICAIFNYLKMWKIIIRMMAFECVWFKWAIQLRKCNFMWVGASNWWELNRQRLCECFVGDAHSNVNTFLHVHDEIERKHSESTQNQESSGNSEKKKNIFWGGWFCLNFQEIFKLSFWFLKQNLSADFNTNKPLSKYKLYK
jgi:hypothetical protein